MNYIKCLNDNRNNKHINLDHNNDKGLQLVLNKQMVPFQCGKCEYCRTSKRSKYSNRVKSQFKKTKYNYLLTFTFSNKNIKTLFTKNEYDQLLYNDPKELLSKYSILSKRQVNNIIRNLKKKFNNYYKTKVDFNYMLSGEYGGETNRAHFHIILMLSHAIPNLVKEQCRGEHFKSDFLKSKQYDNYDLEIISPQDYNSTSQYLTKYISKSNNDQLEKYNLEEEKYIMDCLDHNIEPDPIITKKGKIKKITKPREFIKISRGLGIKLDQEKKEDQEYIKQQFYYLLKNNLLNYYYKHKYLFMYLKSAINSNSIFQNDLYKIND